MGRKKKEKRLLSLISIKKTGKTYWYWRKYYKNKPYLFPADKTQSDNGYEGALRAWLAKKDDLDKQVTISPYQLIQTSMSDLEYLRRVYVDDNNRLGEILCLSRISNLKAMLEGTIPLLKLEHEEQGDFIITADEWEQFGDRIAKLKLNPETSLITHHISQFLEYKKASALSIGRLDNIRTHLDVFSNWIGPEKSLDAINNNSDAFVTFRNKLAGGELCKRENKSTFFIRDVMQSVVQFARWLDETDKIVAPKCIRYGSKILKIDVDLSNKENKTFSNDELKSIFTQTKSDRFKLYYLLMANCGMTQKDVADIKKCEYDAVKHTITRKRSKTRKKINVPTITFKLWPETYQLLTKYADKDKSQDLLLLNERGRKIVHEHVKDDGKKSKVDTIALEWYRLKQKTGIQKEITCFRNTGATRIKGKFGAEIARHFLGHVKLGVMEVNYLGKNDKDKEQDSLTDAINWLYRDLEIAKLTI